MANPYKPTRSVGGNDTNKLKINVFLAVLQGFHFINLFNQYIILSLFRHIYVTITAKQGVQYKL